MVKLGHLLKKIPSYELLGEKDIDIKELHMDSREVKEGSLFFCISGYTVDGHDYIDEAIKQGAVAIVAEKDVSSSVPVVRVRDTKRAMALIAAEFYQHPTRKMKLVGVTGTNGKTTITHLIEKILSDYGKQTGMIGTMYTKYADKEITVDNTTPESLTLQKFFSNMVDEEVEVAAMEVSSHALQLGRVRGLHFDLAVFTNLSQDHLDFHETMENYALAKGLLFAQLGNGYYEKENQPVAVLNRDDDTFDMLATVTAAPILTYGIENEGDMMAKNITLHEKGSQFTLAIGMEEIKVEFKMAGTFSIYNSLAAAAATYILGVPLQEIGKSLENIEGVSGRFEQVDLDGDFHAIVDYAHTPDSLENVLETIREFAKGKVSVVVGCGGDRDKTKRPKMAAIAEKYADHVYLTSDNPRTEDPNAILEDMIAGISSENYSVIENRKEAIYEAVMHAESDEMILIAGKGHETYQTIGKENHYFDDRVVVKEAAKERRENGGKH